MMRRARKRSLDAFVDNQRATQTHFAWRASRQSTSSWTYDGLNRLARETFDGFDGGGQSLAYTDRYSFDLAGNRLGLNHDDRTSGGEGSAGPDAVLSYRYDANDRLLRETKDIAGTSTGDTCTIYGYGTDDRLTDQTSKRVHEGLSDQGTLIEQTTYSYDALGRMTQVSITRDSTTSTVSYRYDHNGFRVERTEGSQTTVYHVDPANPSGYAQVIEEGTDANADHQLQAAEVQKAYTLAREILTQASRNLVSGQVQALRLLSDAHGSTRAALDVAVGPVAAAVVQNYVYSAYGMDLGLQNALTNVRYAGQMLDPLTGLSFNRARWYDPSTGRFGRWDYGFAGIASDPLTWHKYLYASANPINRIDPSGNMELPELMVWGGLAMILAGIGVSAVGVQTNSPNIAAVGKWMFTVGGLSASAGTAALLAPGVPAYWKIAASLGGATLAKYLWNLVYNEGVKGAEAAVHQIGVETGLAQALATYAGKIPLNGRIIVRPGSDKWWEVSRISLQGYLFENKSEFLRQDDVIYDYMVVDSVNGQALITVSRLVNGTTGELERKATYSVSSFYWSGLKFERASDENRPTPTVVLPGN